MSGKHKLIGQPVTSAERLKKNTSKVQSGLSFKFGSQQVSERERETQMQYKIFDFLEIQ
jgi:hypothetical protein